MKNFFILLTASLLLFCSCNDTELESWVFEGTAIEAISEETKTHIQSLELPEGAYCKVVVDSICPPNKLITKKVADGNAFIVHVYLEPRLIKAEAGGAIGGELTGAAGSDYIQIQKAYADGAPLETSLISMMDFLETTHKSTTEKYSKLFLRTAAGQFKSTINNVTSAVTFFIKPYDNFYGKLLKPYYALSYMCLARSGSAQSGLVLMTIILFLICLGLFCIIGMLAKRRLKVASLVVFILNLVSAFSIFPIIIFALFLSMPQYENVIALKEIYGFENADILTDIYTTHTFSPSSIGLIIIALVLCFAYIAVTEINKRTASGKTDDNITEEAVEQRLENSSFNTMLPLLLCAAIIDKVFILAYISFYSLKLAILLTDKLSTMGNFWFKRNSEVVFICTIIVGVLTFKCFSTNADEITARSEIATEKAYAHLLYTKAEIDSMSYTCGSHLHTEHYGRGYRRIDIVAAMNGMDDALKLKEKDSQIKESKYQSYLTGYNLGMREAYNRRYTGVGELNVEKIEEGFKDCRARRYEFSDYVKEKITDNWQNKRDEFERESNLKEGIKFLEENAKKPNVVKQKDGLQYIIHNTGKGKKPHYRSTVVINYVCKNIHGDIYDQGQEITFPLNGVIKGLSNGILLLNVGGKATLFVPSELAHGAKGAGLTGPNEVTIYEVELLKIN